MRSAECGISVKGRSSSDPSIDTPHSAFHTPHYLAPILTLRTMTWLTSPETWIALLTLTVREIILVLGGLFLIWKSTREIHDKLEGEEGRQNVKAGATFGGVIVQIALLDIVFSLDSVITAVGMVRQVGVMIAAIVLAVLVMLVAAGPISNFVHRHPTLKMLALSFLLLIGVTLIADGLGQHIPKGYVYFAMGFSVFVKSLNLRLLRKAAPVHLKESITP